MTDIALRAFRPGFFARLIARLVVWMDEPVGLDATTPAHFNEQDWDLPVHHPVQS